MLYFCLKINQNALPGPAGGAYSATALLRPPIAGLNGEGREGEGRGKEGKGGGRKGNGPPMSEVR